MGGPRPFALHRLGSCFGPRAAHQQLTTRAQTTPQPPNYNYNYNYTTNYDKQHRVRQGPARPRGDLRHAGDARRHPRDREIHVQGAADGALQAAVLAAALDAVQPQAAGCATRAAARRCCCRREEGGGRAAGEAGAVQTRLQRANRRTNNCTTPTQNNQQQQQPLTNNQPNKQTRTPSSTCARRRRCAAAASRAATTTRRRAPTSASPRRPSGEDAGWLRLGGLAGRGFCLCVLGGGAFL